MITAVYSPYSSLFTVLFILPWILAVAAWDCNIQPLVLPYQNATFKEGLAINRGIPVRLGDSIQGLRITFTSNNTRLRNSKDCTGNDTEITACEGAVGGVYDLTKNFTSELPDRWNVLTIDPPPSTAVSRGYDRALFSNGPTIEDFPFEVWHDDAVLSLAQAKKSELGLGARSSVFERFLRDGRAPSNYTGLYFGSRSYTTPLDGELVIGGWNAERVGGGFINHTIGSVPMNISCSLTVYVTGAVLNNNKGSFPLIQTGDGRVPACIDPLQNAITFTNLMYQRWSDATQHPSLQSGTPNFTTQTYPLENEPLIGTLTIELEGGYRATIPHHELVSPERGPRLDNKGEYGVVNSSRIMAAVSSGYTDFGEDFGMLLGGVFLTETYLVIDWENNKFGLAPAVSNDGKSDIRKVCSRNTTIGSTAPKTATSTSASASAPTANTPKLGPPEKIAIATSIPSIFLAALAVYFGYKGVQHFAKHQAANLPPNSAQNGNADGIPLNNTNQNQPPQNKPPAPSDAAD